MVKKQETSKEEHCVNSSVFQEYITAARLVNWQVHLPLFSAWLFTVIYATFSSVFVVVVVYFNSENDLEEVLTFYTQKNKSSTVFLGTKVRSVKKDLHEVNASGNCENSKSEFLLCFFPTKFLLL